MPSALVTGSSRGIGRAIALRFARDGYDVVVNYRTSKQAAETAAKQIESETDRDAIVVQADVSDPDDIDTLVERAIEAFGGLDHVVNNAGIEAIVPTEELPLADFDALVDVNLNSAFAVTKATLPLLRRSDDQPGASVVNVSSRVASAGAAPGSHYVSSKAALIGLTKSHAREFAPDIRVNAVAPGKIDTDMNADHSETERQENRRSIPLDRYGTPAEVARVVGFLRDATYVTGETVHVNGGETMV